MANANEHLADAYEVLKAHEQTLHDLILDVQGLQATLTGHNRPTFDQYRKNSAEQSADTFDENMRQFDALIAKFRGR